LHSLKLDLRGTLGRKLKRLRKIATKEKFRIWASESEKLVGELLKMSQFLKLRNAGAHFLVEKPDVGLKEANEFLQKIYDLYRLEQERRTSLFKNLFPSLE
jgi:hypothetical protein